MARSTALPPDKPAGRAIDTVRVVVLGPNEFGRSCMVAGLIDADHVEAEACDDPGEYQGPTPDVVLLQEAGDARGGDWLTDHLRRAGSAWPDTPLVVLARDTDASLRLCLDAGVHACLPSQVSAGQLMAAVRLTVDKLMVYPARFLAMHAAAIGGREAPAGAPSDRPGRR